MKIYHYKNALREGVIVQTDAGWGEVSPLPGWSQETLDQALAQLQAIRNGWSGTLYPSVAFGLASANTKIELPLKVPAALLFMGTKDEILAQAEKGRDFTYAKVKFRTLCVQDAVTVARRLKDHFRLRIDLNQKWDAKQLNEFCSHFTPADFEFFEDPPHAPKGFAVAADQIDIPGAIKVWKPTVKGLPPHNRVILSSAFESGVGLAHIARLAAELRVPAPIGVGTYRFLDQDLLEEPLELKDGFLTVHSLRPKQDLLTSC